MANDGKLSLRKATPRWRRWFSAFQALGSAFFLFFAMLGTACAQDDDDYDDDEEDGRYCSATARVLFDACQFEASDDRARARALCINLSDRQERSECLGEARSAYRETGQLCAAQHTARRQLCGALGEGRYEPDFDPGHFQTNFRNTVNPNPYFPLHVGNAWRYAGGDETIMVSVRDETKLIEGVPCVVVNDRVEIDGRVFEDTDDWFALRHDRTVDYCGESVRNYEFFPGDRPSLPELVDLDGSWKAGREGDLPGTQFLGTPTVGAVYRQEFSPGNAEDAAEVLSTTYGFGRDPKLDQFVPRALVQLLCGAYNCVVTREFTPLEPGASQRMPPAEAPRAAG